LDKTDLMKPEKKNSTIPDQSQIDRREAIKRAGYYLLSTTTLLVLMKSQAKAQTSPAPPPGGGGFD
jgi:hypothetical protein